MKIEIENYESSLLHLPNAGKQIIGHEQLDEIVVYQAYNNSIANYTVANQKLGGSKFSYERMSWIKPNFLWMMFRCGWAEKENQERVLALWMKKSFLEKILSEAVPSTYKPHLYKDIKDWQRDLKQKEVRLQWDPDHSPYGGKPERRAIQLGLKGEMLEQFGQQEITLIEDVTDFVKEQHEYVKSRQLNHLMIPVERTTYINDAKTRNRIGISKENEEN
ncbi:DUF4291 domain-containing protein [Taibaiella soli]|uniref:DUF4291 domain-containing protein n=1 Tax=Taibaiella soli TaxID=1649169 RepID=A0A2W2ADD6_9BACT|nr:DUF4291 domain-containing protein [Taibaiella soli]PZF71652.1 DUF4291 domain-containing protein [Taibaiella soli]